ncbi:unnamed protein product [Colias eurytheme]|nr:unnamed protein product [Colias eurytheme]
MDRCYRGKRMVQLSLKQNESSTILDENTGEFRNVDYMRSPTSTNSSVGSLDFSKSVSDYIPSDDDSDITFYEEQYNETCEEILDPSTGLFTVTQDGDGRAKKRRTRGQGDRSQWKRQKNSEARLKGKAYTGFKKDERGKYVQIACKPAKSLGKRCRGHVREQKQGGPKQFFTCDDITESQREAIFNDYWKLQSWEARKAFVRSLVLKNEPQYRRKSVQEETKKNISMKYFLLLQTDDRTVKFHVCKEMFMSTIGIGKRQLRDWLLTNTNDTTEANNNNNLAGDKEMSVISFLDKLAKIESHYCRASSRKLYLEPVWDSYNHIFKEYEKSCMEENKIHCSRRYFLKTFRKLNYDIFSPRKDQCNKCISFKQGHLSQTEYDAHQTKKCKARNEKEDDKVNSENQTLVYSMDVQAVLLCPNIQASATYYKTKLKVHNYTIYNMKNKEAACYIWHEGNGGLESDVFASNLTKHLKNDIDKFNPTKIILWSDGCGYQNRCLTLANALLDLAIENNVIIEQKYLEVGHTQMEVDSIHSVIEKKLRGRKRDIFVPADNVSIIKSARQDPEP